jgi:hypothetical protein
LVYPQPATRPFRRDRAEAGEERLKRIARTLPGTDHEVSQASGIPGG